MAKETKTLSGFLKFNDDLKKILKDGGKDVEPILFTPFGAITEYISTGNLMLNALLSGSIYGGIPNARSVEIAGESGAGKSFICFNITREAAEMGYFIYYIDTEGAMEEADFEKFGVNKEMVQIIRTIKTFSSLKYFVNSVIKKKQEKEFADVKIMIIVDSYAMLQTDKEVEDAKIGKTAADMGLRAKEGRQLFRNITLELSNLQIPFIYTNHTSDSLDVYNPGKKVSGGGGPLYAASIVLMVQKKPLKDADGKTKTGIIVLATADKNRLAKPGVIEFHISFHKGMNKLVGIHQYVNWASCGIDLGKLMEKQEYDKILAKGNKESEDLKKRKVDFFKSKDGKEWAAVLYDTAQKLIIRDECKMVDKAKLFTAEILTDKVLKDINENIILPTFKYKNYNQMIQEEMEDLTALDNTIAEESEENQVL